LIDIYFLRIQDNISKAGAARLWWLSFTATLLAVGRSSTSIAHIAALPGSPNFSLPA
jgi:hypothetical protein